MSEVHRYKVVTMLSENGNRIGYDHHIFTFSKLIEQGLKLQIWFLLAWNDHQSLDFLKSVFDVL